MNYRATFRTEGVYTPDGLLAVNSNLLVSRIVTIKAGQVLTRGAVLGTDASGKCLLSVATAEDGSETPWLILAEDCDATTADKEALAYARGDFNDFALTFGDGHTIASLTDAMRGNGITIVKGMV